MAESPNWGILFFHYDWFSATRTEVVCEIKYDTFITVYKSDCDYYPRVRQKWRTLNHSGICKDCRVHVGYFVITAVMLIVQIVWSSDVQDPFKVLFT
jgi:predicted NAD/FAD-binding protein